MATRKGKQLRVGPFIADFSGRPAAHDVINSLVSALQASSDTAGADVPSPPAAADPPAKKPRRPPAPTSKTAMKSLIKAAREGNLESVQTLLARGVPANASDDETTALHQALRAPANALAIVECLIGHGADVNIRNSMGTTPLMSAALNNKPELVKVLLQHGAKPNRCNMCEQTALMMATLECSRETVEMLLKAGADVAQKGSNGECALHHAVVNGNTAAAAVLLEAGADPLASDNDGTTPLQLAKRMGRKTLYELLCAAAERKDTAQAPPSAT